MAAQNNLPLVSVIIPTYNRAQMLGITIESFVNQQYPHDNYEIIVSDNNSRDNTKDIVSQWQSKSDVKIKYIFEGRQGVHYARNSAGKIASGEILYYTDDDMIADGFLLPELVKVFSLDPQIGTVTGLVLPKFDYEPPEWVKKFLINANLSLTDKDKPEDLIVSKYDIGVYSCHQAIRRDVFFRSGGFNPENTAGVWIGDGETGLNMKIKALGYKFAYTSKSVIHHMIPKSRTTLQYLIKRIGNQGFCDSYTEYRQHRNRGKIMPIMLKRNVMDALKLMLSTLINVLIGRLSWHFMPANFSYFCKRNIYDLKLYRDENFRKLVEIDDWLTN